VTETAVSVATAEGPNVTLAVESELEMVPPVVGDTMVGGGDSPLAVFVVGSGAVPSVPVGVVAPP
jgi:hypothetical protein